MVDSFCRVRIGGHLYGDASWSIGLNFAVTVGGGPVQGAPYDAAKLEEWRDDIRALNGGNIVGGQLLSILGNRGTIDYVRVAQHGADGKEALVSLVELAQPIAGTTGSVMPAQTSLTFSLLTGRPGASYRGRVYWPCTAIALNAQGRLGGAALDPLAADMADFINRVGNLGDALVLNTTPVVLSTRRNLVTPISSVRVGNRLDIQRRRAESQKESYGSALVPK